MSTPLSRDILTGLKEFGNAVSSGDVSGKLTCRKVKLNLKPTTYDPELVRVTRHTLGTSQAIFAEFLGVSTGTVQAWEQGENPVTGAPARLMDEIRRNPEYWRTRIAELAVMEPT